MNSLEAQMERALAIAAKKAVTEGTVQTDIHKHLDTLDQCYHLNAHGGAFTGMGVPDILACYRGIFLGLEVKKKTTKATKNQETQMRLINKAAGIALVVRSVADVKAVIKRIDKELDTDEKNEKT